MIAVACAIIEHKDRILVTQRGLHKSEGGLWEFPGGKLEAAESPEACITREIAEELNIAVESYQRLPAVIHHYPAKSIELIPLLCRWTGGELQLHEHHACRWLEARELPGLDWCPADVPVVEVYLAWRQQKS